MFCYQCEQTQQGKTSAGCSSAVGNCGKDAETSDLQDIFIYQLRGIARYALVQAQVENDVHDFIQHGMFTTLTNVNFDPDFFVSLINQAAQLQGRLKGSMVAESKLALDTGPAAYIPGKELSEILEHAEQASIAPEKFANADAHGLFMLILYGLKGVCAYAYHARQLGVKDADVDMQIVQYMAELSEENTNLEKLLQRSLEVGQLNLRVMELLDQANTDAFGHPEISQVNLSPVKGKAILVSGHDLHDLALLLEQTEGTGVQVYTHGEMLPGHSYPGLKKYSHLAGNYGGAWQNQILEFTQFPGPIVMTSNCLIKPSRYYQDRIYTCGPVGWPGIKHISNGDFKEVIEQAKQMDGYAESGEPKTITTGFGRNTVMSVADKVVSAVKEGHIRHFFVIGGCDGAKPGRNYYTELADKTPDDTVMLTLGCAKYRFNTHEYGDIGGIPRLLDVGQCNDAYSAIKIAAALSDAFDCELNELPLSLMISWFEQKATAVLLSLLAVGVKGIHLGPTLPVFLTPKLLQILTERFDVRTNHSAGQDLQLALGAA